MTVGLVVRNRSTAHSHKHLVFPLFSSCVHTTGTTQLDLSNRPLADKDAAKLLSGLPHLKLLTLSGCKKLSDIERSLSLNCVASPADAAALKSNGAPRATLEALDMQRCFQLDSQALSQLLAAAAPPCSLFPSLRTLALSHLEFEHWPFCHVQPGPCSALTAQRDEREEQPFSPPPMLPTSLEQDPPPLPHGPAPTSQSHQVSALTALSLEAPSPAAGAQQGETQSSVACLHTERLPVAPTSPTYMANNLQVRATRVSSLCAAGT